MNKKILILSAAIAAAMLCGCGKTEYSIAPDSLSEQAVSELETYKTALEKMDTSNDLYLAFCDVNSDGKLDMIVRPIIEDENADYLKEAMSGGIYVYEYESTKAALDSEAEAIPYYGQYVNSIDSEFRFINYSDKIASPDFAIVSKLNFSTDDDNIGSYYSFIREQPGGHSKAAAWVVDKEHADVMDSFGYLHKEFADVYGMDVSQLEYDETADEFNMTAEYADSFPNFVAENTSESKPFLGGKLTAEERQSDKFIKKLCEE